MILRFLYIVAIGLLLAGFIGLGIATFYQAPKAPEYPTELNLRDAVMTEEQKTTQKAYDEQQKSFTVAYEKYSRNISIGLIVASLLILGASIIWVGKLDVIGDGITLGGVFTLFYGLIRAMMGGDEKMRFIAIAIGLVVVIGLSYWKFVRHPESSQALG